MKTSLRATLASFAGLVATAALSLSASASDPIYRVDLNKTQILRLPAAAGSVIVGNPSIADVTIHSPNMIFVVGRGYGETNLVILDRNGGTMVDADIQVTAITPTNGIRLFNASSRRSYSCSPYCQPSPVLGDSADFVGANAGQTPESSGVGAIFDSPLAAGGSPFDAAQSELSGDQ
ncbi:pilus assembly protein N-terminal domain-containing protein [Algimonas porphyrae]|nr:pilus assembly protein N-terminal domain-containing protein [Algimonas porphyrae]